MGSNPLRIETRVNVGPLQAGMDQAAQAVKTSTEQMQASFSTAAASAQAASKDMVAAAQAEYVAYQEAAASIESSNTRAAESFERARGAARLLGEEAGVHLNRELARVLSQSSLLGPALNAAFGAIAVIGFVGIATQIADKISEWVANTFIYTEQMKAAYAATIAYSNANLQAMKDQEAAQAKQLELSHEIALLGKTPVEQAQLKAQWAEQAIGVAEQNLKAAQDEAQSYRDQIAALEKKRALLAAEVPKQTAASVMEGPSIVPDEAQKGVADLDRKIADLNDKLAMQQSAIREAQSGLKGVAVASLEAAHAQAEVTAEWDRTPWGKKGFSSVDQAKESLAKLAAEFKNPDLTKGQQAFGGIAASIDQINVAADTAVAKAATDWAKMASDAEAAYRKMQQVAEQTYQDQIRAAEETNQRTVQLADQELAAKEITAKQAVKIKIEALNEEYEAERAAVLQRINTLGPQELKARQELDDKLVQLQRSYNQQIQTIDAQANKQLIEGFQQAFDKIASTFNSGLIRMLSGHQSFARTMQQLWNSIASTAIEAILKVGEKWIEQHVLMTAVDKIFHLTSQADTVASNAAKMASNKALAVSEAGLAGAGAAASMAAAPFPIDLTAPGFAATMFSTAMGFAAFQQGGIVPSDMPALVHAQEMVLPSHVTNWVLKAAGADRSSQSRGDSNFHIHASISTVDAHGMKELLERNVNSLGRMAHKYLRRRAS